MIRSMTGYGAADTILPGGRALHVVARSVNHRRLDASVHLPSGWDALEAVAASRIRKALRRGRVVLSVRCGDGSAGDSANSLQLDEERVRRAVGLLRDACRSLGVDDRLDAGVVARLPGAWLAERDGGGPPPDAERLAACVDAALRDLAEMRSAEGRRLEEALRRSAAEIAKGVDLIEAKAPERLLRQRDRLRERVRLLVADAGAGDGDEERLAREVAYMAAKWDVSEELVRMRSHLRMLLDVLGAPDGEPAGKRLGFVVQEMGREANTIGAKANDAGISAVVVAVKDELERVREQAENVE